MIEYEYKLRRKDKRVLAVLLTGAANLGNYTIWSLSGAGAHTTVLLARLERCGAVTSEWEVVPPTEDRPRRRFYRLTPEGRQWALDVLRLKDGAA